MRIVRYRLADRGPFTGCLQDGFVCDLRGDPLEGSTVGERVALLDDVTLLEPCRPTKIVAVAVNFEGIEGFSPTMQEPLVFVMPGSSVCAPGSVVVNPFPELPWWGEAELGVVLRRRLKNATASDVADGILGFTIGNDVTVENVDGRDHHLARSKCPDGFCPIGPWIDTDFDATDCVIEAVQNSEVIRRGRSSQQFWQWAQILERVSSWLTLEPWDVVLTGNPPDTEGMRYLGDADEYTARVVGLGELTNRFVRRTDADASVDATSRAGRIGGAE